MPETATKADIRVRVRVRRDRCSSMLMGLPSARVYIVTITFCSYTETEPGRTGQTSTSELVHKKLHAWNLFPEL